MTSAPATLTVTPAPQPPSITTQPANQTVTEPESATFSVVATGDAPLTYQWRRKGEDMPGEVSASVTLSSTTVGNSGDWFDVVVSNVVGSVTSASATLTVTVPQPPSITTEPASQTVTAPAGATFSVVATGDTPLTYQWRRNGADMSGEVSASVALSSTTVGDNGDMFDVVVSNAVGSVTSASATLTVEVLPPPPPGRRRSSSMTFSRARRLHSGSSRTSSTGRSRLRRRSRSPAALRATRSATPTTATTAVF